VRRQIIELEYLACAEHLFIAVAFDHAARVGLQYHVALSVIAFSMPRALIAVARDTTIWGQSCAEYAAEFHGPL
jgi:hypothetical protein